MKRLLAITAAALITLTATAARFTPATGSSIRITGTSTLHEWSMQGTTINGQIEAASLTDWTTGTPAVKVTIPVNSIKSEHDRMDRLMADALKSATSPEIRYELTQAQLDKASADQFTVKTRGRLSIAGVTRELDMSVSGVRNGNDFILTGQAPIRMSDFGIKPPTAMMNTIRTGDAVTVTFRWVVAGH